MEDSFNASLKSTMETLSCSRESIRKATKLCEENIAQAPFIFSQIMSRAQEVPPRHRLPLLYLIDSLCQVACTRIQEGASSLADEPFLEIAGQTLPRVVSTVCPVGPDTPSSLKQNVAKVCSLWVRKSVFPADLTELAAAEAGLQLEATSGKRKAPSSPSRPVPPTNPDPSVPTKMLPPTQKAVYIWRLDDTLVLLRSLLTGNFADRTGKDVGTAIGLGERMERLVREFGEQHLFSDHLESVDVQTISALDSYDDGIDLRGFDFESGDPSDKRILAYRLRIIRNLYEKVRPEHLLSAEQLSSLRSAQEEIDRYTDGWMVSVRRVMTLIQNDPHGSLCAVSTGSLVRALGKAILYDISAQLPIDAITVCRRDSLEEKQALVRSLLEKHGPAVYYYFGASAEDEEVANEFQIPFVMVKTHQDLVELERQLKKILEWRKTEQAA